MELLSPAGSLEKLAYAYRYGADAAYMGVEGFSLRANASNASPADYAEISRIKGQKKLYGALNLFAQDDDLDRLRLFLDSHHNFPFDAWIVSDLGSFRVLRSRLPKAEVHLSTQANCLNAESARAYRDLGFSRIIPGRELSLANIARIKAEVPDLAMEVFVHGAMCMSYSGRCFLSAELAGRSANKGDCAHTCRWAFKALGKAGSQNNDGSEPSQIVLEETKRPGQYFPILETEGHSIIFSSNDLNMVRHLDRLRDAGVDSLKIEGRMKSLYYVAVVTRAYRVALDHIQSNDQSIPNPKVEAAIAELEAVSHRPYATGFFFDSQGMSESAIESYESTHRFLGTIGASILPPANALEALGGGTWYAWTLDLLNTLRAGMVVEVLEPQGSITLDNNWAVSSMNGQILNQGVQQKEQIFYSRINFEAGAILRVLAHGQR